jgi:hypothetical protein
LQKLAAAFATAQKQLEGEGFGIGSLFIRHLLIPGRRFGDFRECEPEARNVVVSYILQLRSDCEWECNIIILMAFLNASVQSQIGHSCSQEAYERVRGPLSQLAQTEIDIDIGFDFDNIRTIPEEPASDDFHTFVPSTYATPFGAGDQVLFDVERRTSAFHPMNYWQNTPAELKHLARVDLKVLGFCRHLPLSNESSQWPGPSQRIVNGR